MKDLINNFHGSLRLLVGLFGVLLFVLIIFFSLMALNSFEKRNYLGDTQPTIDVSGKGSVLVIPDIAEFNFSVQYEADGVPEAQEEVARRVEEITEFLKGSGLEDKHIKTTGYSVRPRYEWRDPEGRTPDSGRKRVLVGYEVTQTTEVVVKEMEEAGSLVGGVGDRGASDVSGVVFSVEDEEEVKKEARSKAIGDAKQEAENLADDLGVKLVRIVDFSERRSVSPMMRDEQALMESRDADSVEPSFEPGEEEIESEVRIKYEIR
ncbi:MAG: SIMPL domain-containing protein [Candidatus Paceibacterota bacterium]